VAFVRAYKVAHGHAGCISTVERYTVQWLKYLGKSKAPVQGLRQQQLQCSRRRESVYQSGWRCVAHMHVMVTVWCLDSTRIDASFVPYPMTCTAVPTQCMHSSAAEYIHQERDRSSCCWAHQVVRMCVG